MEELKNKVAVITGATSGIGAACASKLALRGASIALVGRNAERGLALEEELSGNGGKARFFSCDVSKEKMVKETCIAIGELYGRVDILINNAGVMPVSAEIENLSVGDWKQTFDINVNGVLFFSRCMKPFLQKSRGCIVNNASIAGLHHYAAGRSYAYSASKAAVIQFSHQMAKNYGSEGIRVNCICPGIIDTPILGSRDRDQYIERIPLGRVGQPEDVANVIAFLVSEEAAYLTGVVLPIDGGASL